MKFFNLDLHVSVIEDMRTQFEALGHEVESHLLSGHNWALQRPRASKGTGEGAEGKVGYGGVNCASWEALFHDWPALKKVTTFQQEQPELWAFDGFIATYPAAFALLYDIFPGKIIMNIPVRYELGFTHSPEAWAFLNRRLLEMTDRQQLFPVANSAYDASYYHYFTGRPCRYIPSTCDYIERFAPRCTNKGTLILSFGEHAGCRAMQKAIPQVLFVRDVMPGNYSHKEVAQNAKAIVWIPYTTSIMSFFEHYWLNIPLFVPTERFLVELQEKAMALSSFSWHQRPLEGSTIAPAQPFQAADPHTRTGLATWMHTYDFYNPVEFPHLTYFDSWEHLRHLLGTQDREDLVAATAAMGKHNQDRKLRNLAAWANLLKEMQ